jgi:hypothetical protein
MNDINFAGSLEDFEEASKHFDEDFSKGKEMFRKILVEDNVLICMKINKSTNRMSAIVIGRDNDRKYLIDMIIGAMANTEITIADLIQAVNRDNKSSPLNGYSIN